MMVFTSTYLKQFMVKIKSESLQLVVKTDFSFTTSTFLAYHPVRFHYSLLHFLSTFNPIDYTANSGNRQEAWNGEGKDPAEGTGRNNT